MAFDTTTNPRVIYLVDADEALRTQSSRRLGELGYTVCEFDQLGLAIEDLSEPVADDAAPEQLCALVNVDRPTVEASHPEARTHLIEPAMVRALRELEVPVIYASAHAAQMNLQSVLAMAFMAIKEGAATVLALPFEESELEGELERAFRPHAAQMASAMAEMTASASEKIAAIRSPDKVGSPEYQRYLQKLESLTPRERQIHDLMRQGKTSKMIAKDLSISPKTVENCRRNVLTKMDVDSTVSLLAQISQWAQG
jgi:FixJ family two-component response regulator